jgi:hypothetical protein
MPSEPDHQMDAWLRTYAQQRREQAGEPLELDAATRHRLQAEVARHYGQPQDQVRPWWNRLGLFWPRVGFALGVLVVLGVILVSLLQPGSPPEQMAKSTDASKPSVVSSEPAKEKLAGGLETPPLAPVPQEEVARQVAVKPQAAPMQVAAPASLPPAVAGPGAEVVAARPSSAPTTMKLSKAFNYRFRRTEQSRGVGAELSTGSAPDVLVRFELEQTEAGVRIRDADGSVYQGTWLTAQEPVTGLGLREPTAGLAGERKREVLYSKATPSPQPIPEPRAFATADALTRFSFSVSGTNRSAKQKLTFTGFLQSIPDAPRFSQPAAEGQTRPPRTWLLRGTLQLEGTNAWEIQAVEDTR